jgi:hypothetical protein
MSPSYSIYVKPLLSEQLFPSKIVSLPTTLFFFTSCHSLGDHCIVLVSFLSYFGVLITRSYATCFFFFVFPYNINLEGLQLLQSLHDPGVISIINSLLALCLLLLRV